MDPISAAFQAFSSFNTFLCTPAGQRLADMNTGLMLDILEKLHNKMNPGQIFSVNAPQSMRFSEAQSGILQSGTAIQSK